MIFEPVDGGLRLTIDNHSRDVVAHLLGELRHEVEVAKTTTPAALEPHMKRLFPTAYHNDEQHNDEYRRLIVRGSFDHSRETLVGAMAMPMMKP